MIRVELLLLVVSWGFTFIGDLEGIAEAMGIPSGPLGGAETISILAPVVVLEFSAFEIAGAISLLEDSTVEGVSTGAAKVGAPNQA